MSLFAAFEAFFDYQHRRNEHPDNQRMSRLRRGPEEDNIERLRSRDEFGSYYVVDCNLDSEGNWQCKHHYHDYPMSQAWHTLFKNGGHYFQNPDRSQSYYHPQRSSASAWKRDFRSGPKRAWPNPRSPCVASVNPPPRWWMEQHRIVPFDGQNDLADDLDRRFVNVTVSLSHPHAHPAPAGSYDDGFGPYSRYYPDEVFDPYAQYPQHAPGDQYPDSQNDTEFEEDIAEDRDDPALDENDNRRDDVLESDDLKQDGADQSDISSEHSLLENVEAASQSSERDRQISVTVANSSAAAAQSPESVRLSRTPQRASRKQAAVSDEEDTGIPASEITTRSLNETPKSHKSRSQDQKPESSRKRRAEANDEPQPKKSRKASKPESSREHEPDANDEPQPKKSRKASKPESSPKQEPGSNAEPQPEKSRKAPKPESSRKRKAEADAEPQSKKSPKASKAESSRKHEQDANAEPQPKKSRKASKRQDRT